VTAHPGWPARLVAGPIELRGPRLRDGKTWSEIRLRNELWLRDWEPTSPHSWAERHVVSAWPPLMSALRRAARAGTMLPFMICYGGQVVGQLSVSNVVHGVLRSGTAGYWIDKRYAGRGIVPTALALAIDHCLTEVGLHRVEIDIRPENAASLRVVAKLGMRQEAFYERYLDIDGGWRDHLGFAVTVEEVRGSSLLSRVSRLPDPP
jgi:ribosomal-protein-alanine N-acetyltransferase